MAPKRLLIISILMVFFFGACSPAAEISSQPSETPLPSVQTAVSTELPLPSATSAHLTTPEETYTSTPLPAETPVPSPTTLVYPENGMKGWVTYTNQGYGFSFQYPADWRLEEAGGTLQGHAAWLYPATTDKARLQIAYKDASDDMPLGQTGLGSGELIDWGAVSFAGEALRRQVLVSDKKDMTVLYLSSNNQSLIQQGNLVFNFSLNYLGSWTDSEALSNNVETISDLVIASIQISNN